MQKIDRLGWAAGICCEMGGKRIGVRVNDPAVLTKVRDCLPFGSKVTSAEFVDGLFSLRVAPRQQRAGTRAFNLAYAGLSRIARTTDLTEALLALESYLALSAMEAATDHVYVHAGAVAWNDRAIVLPGSTMAGKTTLVAALLKAGATYLSDEYAVIDRRGRVHGYPRPLTVRKERRVGCAHQFARYHPAKESSVGGHSPPYRCERIGPEAFGSSTETRKLPVSLVAFTRFVPGSDWRPSRLRPARAMIGLLGHVLPTIQNPQSALRILEKATSRSVCIRSTRGDADETARRLLAEAERLIPSQHIENV